MPIKKILYLNVIGLICSSSVIGPWMVTVNCLDGPLPKGKVCAKRGHLWELFKALKEKWDTSSMHTQGLQMH